MAETITLTNEEYEALLAAKAKPTVVVDAAEYNELLAFKSRGSSNEVVARALARVAEVESPMKREQQDHISDCNDMVAQIKKLQGQR